MFTRKFALIVVAGTLLGAGAVQADSVFPESALESIEPVYSQNLTGQDSAVPVASLLGGRNDSVFPESAIEYSESEYSQNLTGQDSAVRVASRIGGQNMIAEETISRDTDNVFPESPDD